MNGPALRRGLRPDVAAGATPDDDRRLPGIDGLRGIAILLVLLFKFMPIYVPGGWLGVDLFFVISGFVITRLILTGVAAERFGLRGFYLARARRLFPALAVMLAVTAIAGLIVMMPSDLVGLAKDIGAVALGVGNIRFWQTVDYWRIQSALPVLHGWSLGVEEQFYLIYPLLLVGAAKRCWNLPMILGIGLVGSLLLFLVCLERASTSAFFLLPPRAWELLVGALVAVAPWRQRLAGWQRNLAAGAGLIAISGAVAEAASKHAFGGYLAIPACLGAAGLILGASRSHDGPIGWALSLRPAQFLGRISYSVYLWHLPILILYAYGSLQTPGRFVRVGLILLTIAIAAASYRWIEMPIRRRQMLAVPGRFVAVFVLSLAGLLVALTGVVASGGLPQRWPEAARAYAVTERARPDGAACLVPSGSGRCRPGAPLDVLVWGDSHGQGMRVLADRLTAAGGAIGFAGQGGCAPLPGVRLASKPECAETADAVLAWIDGHRVRSVLVAVRWDAQSYAGPSATFVAVDGAVVRGRAAMALGLRSLVGRLAQSGIQVILLEPTPVFPFPVTRKLTYLAASGQPIDQAALSGAEYARQLSIFHAIIGDLADRGRVEILQTHDLYCDAAHCPGARDDAALFWDGDHMTAAGYELLAPRLVDLVRRFEVTSPDRSGLPAEATGTAAPR
ncbi:MAG TPA: acyltransferase family protein [Aliidongia sp.]|uniref:acyltransferase family protein n=1 Tax=Aliidongia sp. TaxID=1914230 RepID=UPI002DDD60D0|nr:acyltransferase family protein [Aliidongia sp.]HEV2673454.1 acyltransferase family protein [Aliidongia sp.]